MRGAVVLTYPYGLDTPGGSPLDCAQTAYHLRAAGAQVVVLPVAVLPGRGFRLGRHRLAEDRVVRRPDLDLRAYGVRVEPVSPHPLHSDLDGWTMRRAVAGLLARERIDAVLGFWHEAACLPRLLRARGVIFGMIAAAPYSAWLRPAPGVWDLWREPRGKRSAASFPAVLAWRAALRNPVMRAPGLARRRWLFAEPLRRAQVVFARSGFVRDDVVGLFGVAEERVRVVWCGIQPFFGELRREAPTETASRLLFVGALSRDKGVFDALEALGRAVFRGADDLRLRLAGAGDAEPVWRAAKSLGVADRIDVLGHLDRPALLTELARAQLALLPSHFESFGLAVAEAQAAGLPVVAYAVGAVREVVEDGASGWLVPPGDTEGLAAALLEARRTPGLAAERGARGRERATRLFSWPRAAESMLEELERLTGSGKG